MRGMRQSKGREPPQQASVRRPPRDTLSSTVEKPLVADLASRRLLWVEGWAFSHPSLSGKRGREGRDGPGSGGLQGPTH